MRTNLKYIDTVGQTLDVLKFTCKCFFIDKPSIIEDYNLLVDVFLMLPESWTYDPVKIHLITKLIYEIVQNDFNNELYIITKVININKIRWVSSSVSEFYYFYRSLIWWVDFYRFFPKEMRYSRWNFLYEFR